MKPTRSSKQRDLILGLINEHCKHPTADEVYEAARKLDPKISRGTVYRNLNLLTELGALQRLYGLNSPDHYDHVLTEHYHFICRLCHRVFDATVPYQVGLNHTPKDMPGFQTEGHQLLLIGLCPECAQKNDE